MRYLTSTTALLLLLLGVEGRLRASTPGNEDQPRVKIVRNLQGLGELQGLGGNPGKEHLPLGLCEGDCDEDVDVSWSC